MPNIKSAKKRVKVIAVKTARNKAANSHLKLLSRRQIQLSKTMRQIRSKQFVLL